MPVTTVHRPIRSLGVDWGKGTMKEEGGVTFCALVVYLSSRRLLDNLTALLEYIVTCNYSQTIHYWKDSHQIL